MHLEVVLAISAFAASLACGWVYYRFSGERIAEAGPTATDQLARMRAVNNELEASLQQANQSMERSLGAIRDGVQ